MRRSRLEIEEQGNVTIVHFVDKKLLDEQNIQMVGDDLFRLVDEQGRRQIVIDFGNLQFMSSVALGKLITLHRKLQATTAMDKSHAKLVLTNMDPAIADNFKITRLDRTFTITPDLASAIVAVQTPNSQGQEKPRGWAMG